MKVLFLTNNIISYDLYNWLKHEMNENIILYEDKINLKVVSNIKPNIIISYNYKYIINKEVINYMNNRIINLHISLLPWNRGSHPNLWSYLEDTPKGVSIHIIDEGLDTGDILFQREVYLNEDKETLKTSYEKLHQEIQSLFKENWDNIKIWNVEPKQQKGHGSKHFIKDLEDIQEKMHSWDISIPQFKKIYKDEKGD